MHEYREAVGSRSSGFSGPDSKILRDFSGRPARRSSAKPTRRPPHRAGTRRPTDSTATISAQPTGTRRIAAAVGLPPDEGFYSAQHVPIRRPNTVHTEKRWRIPYVHRLPRARPHHHQVPLPDPASRRSTRSTLRCQVLLENRSVRRLPSNSRRRRRLPQNRIPNMLRQLRIPGDALWPHECAIDFSDDHERRFPGTHPMARFPRRGTSRIWVPGYDLLRTLLIQESHNNPTSGHFDVDKTTKMLQRDYYWPNMADDVRKYVSSCTACQIMKSSHQRVAGLLQPLVPPERPWQHVTMDYVTGLPTGPSGNDAILVIVDRLTKMVHFIACQQNITAEQTAQLFIANVIRLHGLPSAIISDRNPKFTSNFWRHLWDKFGTKLQFSSAYHPQTDGQTERVNQTMEQLIRTTCTDPQTWEKSLPLLEFAYNNATSATTHQSPFFLNYGQDPVTVPAAACYIHDVVIFSKSEEEHAEHLKATLDAIAAAGLTCHPEKCKIARKTVAYLGFEVQGGKMGIQEAKVAVLDKLGAPKDKGVLRALLGFLNYYRRFIPNFSKRAYRLNQLLREGQAWKWGSEEEQARRDLLEAIKAGTVLQLPKKDAPFTIYTDWSSMGMGAVLCQELGGEERVVAYASRSCTATEANYRSYEGEGLAAVWGVTHFRAYLQGRKFTLVTDHQPLLWLMTNQTLTGRNARWAMRLQEYDFVIKHCAGKTLQHADGLSRNPPPAEEQQ
ncbi:hypothetical protein CLOP_g13794 [Closterium sp. NIES-67]|nr:hypothetical protein CLOP_g13794 [Closterium sp. NIES-67]